MNVAIGDYVVGGPVPERFAALRALGVNGVELRCGPQDVERHPLLEPERPAEWRSAARAAGLALPSIFLGYVTTHPLSCSDLAARTHHVEVVERVLAAAAELGASTLVLPLFGQAEPRDDKEVEPLCAVLRRLGDRAAAAGIILGLETVLPVTALLALLQRVNHPAVQIAYDVGSAAQLGNDPAAELRLLTGSVCQIRLRDCSSDGRPVPLGQGRVGPQWGEVCRLWQPPDGWHVLEVPATDDALRWVAASLEFLRAT